MKCELSSHRVVTINAPEWFAREDFMKFVNSPGVMTWHTKGEPPNEYSDVITMYDGGGGEGPNNPDCYEPGAEPSDCLPRDIWGEISEQMVIMGLEDKYVILWITNLI